MISIGQLFSKTFKALKGHWIQAICIFFVFNFAIAIVQAIPAIGGFLSLIISGPLTIGISVYSLKIINDNFPKAENVLDGFKYNLGNGILAYFILIPVILIVGFILMVMFLAVNFLIYIFLVSLFYTQSYEVFINSMDWEAIISPFKVFSFRVGIVEPVLLGLFIITSILFSVVLPWIIASLPFAMTFFIMAEDTSIDAWDAVQKSWNMMKGYKRKYLMLNIVLLLLVIPVILFTLFIGLLWFIPFSFIISAVFYQQIKENNKLID